MQETQRQINRVWKATIMLGKLLDTRTDKGKVMLLIRVLDKTSLSENRTLQLLRSFCIGYLRSLLVKYDLYEWA